MTTPKKKEKPVQKQKKQPEEKNTPVPGNNLKKSLKSIRKWSETNLKNKYRINEFLNQSLRLYWGRSQSISVDRVNLLCDIYCDQLGTLHLLLSAHLNLWTVLPPPNGEDLY